MKDTLEEFFKKTAYSRDAIAHFQRFHSVEPDFFALVIVDEQLSPEDWDALKESIKYLLRLGLNPTLFITQKGLNTDQLQQWADDLNSSNTNTSGQLLLFAPARTQPFADALQQSALKYHKYIYITKKRVQNINQEHYYNRIYLRQQEKLDWAGPTAHMMSWAKPFLESMGAAHALQICSPKGLLEELFTSGGSGCMISIGYDFHWTNPGQVEKNRLFNLIEQGFGKTLKPEYFSSLTDNWSALIEKNYLAAIVAIEKKGYQYLDKIVVAPEYFGHGIGSLLLEELIAKIKSLGQDHPRLVWRARHDNAYLPRYASLLHAQSKLGLKHCGTVSDREYVYHYMGLDESIFKEALEFMQSRDTSFL